MSTPLRIRDTLTPGRGRHRRTRQTQDALAAHQPLCPATMPRAEDLVAALTDLCFRAGADTPRIGYDLSSGVMGPVDWHAATTFLGEAISERGHPTPAAACYALACQVTARACCECSLSIALDPGDHPGLTGPWGSDEPWSPHDARTRGWCLWRHDEKRWISSC